MPAPSSDVPRDRARRLLAVHGEPAHRPLILALTRVAYAAGARLRRRRLRRARAAPGCGSTTRDPETLDYQPAMGRAPDARRREGARRQHLDQRPVDPTLMNGADPERATRERSSRIPGQRVYLREVQRNALRFCVVAYPARGLVRARLPRARPGRGDAPGRRSTSRRSAAWRTTTRPTPGTGTSRCCRRAPMWLNELALDRLVLRAPGTDLEVGMARGGKWCAADETTVHGHRFRANMPTEEVFTSPDPRRTTGTFRCTRPLTLEGRRDRRHPRPVRPGRLVEVARRRRSRPLLPASYMPAIATRGGSARSRSSTRRRASARPAARTASRCWTRTPPATSRSAPATRRRAIRAASA